MIRCDPENIRPSPCELRLPVPDGLPNDCCRTKERNKDRGLSTVGLFLWAGAQAQAGVKR